MNKISALFILLLSISAFSQVDKKIDSINKPTDIVEEVVGYGTNVAKDTLTDALVPLNNEHVKLRKFKTNFRDKYAGSEFQYDVKEENGLLARLREWWRNFLDWFKTDTNETTDVIDEIINIILVILFLAAFSFLLYYLNKKGFIRLFAAKNQQVISEQFIEENINQINFNELTLKAKQENNLRKAVRYYYLWMLKNWSQTNIIQYEPNKTTKQYLKEIYLQENKINFEYVSYIYDNVWYGYHDISETDFLKIEEQLIQLINIK